MKVTARVQTVRRAEERERESRERAGGGEGKEEGGKGEAKEGGIE